MTLTPLYRPYIYYLIGMYVLARAVYKLPPNEWRNALVDPRCMPCEDGGDTCACRIQPECMGTFQPGVNDTKGCAIWFRGKAAVRPAERPAPYRHLGPWPCALDVYALTPAHRQRVTRAAACKKERKIKIKSWPARDACSSMHGWAREDRHCTSHHGRTATAHRITGGPPLHIASLLALHGP